MWLHCCILIYLATRLSEFLSRKAGEMKGMLGSSTLYIYTSVYIFLHSIALAPPSCRTEEPKGTRRQRQHSLSLSKHWASTWGFAACYVASIWFHGLRWLFHLLGVPAAHLPVAKGQRVCHVHATYDSLSAFCARAFVSPGTQQVSPHCEWQHRCCLSVHWEALGGDGIQLPC